MARTRIGITDLARLLDAAAGPVYALDDEQRIVFCNRACLDWTGRAADQLQGARCRYHSPEAGSDEAVAAGLCPPPAAWSGREMAGTVGCVTADGHLSRRRARFLPLGGEDGPVGVVVLVDPRDLTESEAEAAGAEDPEALRLHERLRTLRHEAAARCRIDRLVGQSPAMRRVRAQVELAAGSRASVLIVGPPGSGRQHLAAAIHYGRGPDAAGSLVPLACSVLGPDLVRSTLAALAARRLPPQAPPGTLLLNDADQLPLEAQADVARALASRSFAMRVIATARRRLGDLVRGGEYREDLAGLLSTLVIELPPLGERRGDLPALAQWFVEEANAQSGKQVLGFTSEAIDTLDAYPWPGNVDELIQVVGEAHRRCEGAEITLGDLPPKIHMAVGAAAHPRRPDESIVLDEFLAKMERELICRALARVKGNKTKAAKLLGMTRPRLYRRLVQLGLESPTVAKNDAQMTSDQGSMTKDQ